MIRELVQAGFRLSGQRDPRLIRGLGWAILEGLFTAALYPMLYLLLRAVFEGNATPTLILGYGSAMAASVALRILCGVRCLPLIFSGAYAMMGQARLRIADHLRCLPMGWFVHQRAGDLGARLTSDIEVIEHLWSHFLGVFAAGLAMPVFLLLFLLYLDWQLALMIIITLPLAALVLAWTQRVIAKPGEQLFASNTAAQSALLEYVQGIAVIRGFGRFGEAWRKLERILDQQHAAMLSVESKPAPWVAAFGFVLEFGFVTLVFAGAWYFSHGTLSIQMLLVFLVLALPVYRQLFDVGVSTLLLRFARRALARVEALLAQPMLPEPVAPQSPQGHGIVFEHVRFAYDDAPVLNDLSCSIAPRTLTAVVGPSGAGKSTLVHLIARLWDVQSGAIRIGGVDVREMGTDVLHRHVAMVFQDVVLFSGTVLDNLRIGRPEANREAVLDAARRAQAHDFITALPQGYDTILDEAGASLSGGERQRIAIARALLKDAPILLLDEATASIDPSAEADIQRAMAELAGGRTVVVIAHKLHSVRHADHILVLDGGRLVEQGRHAELLAHAGLYAKLWTLQQAARGWQLGIHRTKAPP